MKILILFVFIFGAVSCGPLEALISQWTVDKNCPANVNVVNDIDEKAYLGVWYEVERYEQPYQLNSDCAFVDYQKNSDDSFSFVTQFITNGFVSDPVGIAHFSYPNAKPKPGKLRVAYIGDQKETNYQILDIDYKNFLMIFNCIQLSENKSYQSYWLLSRKPKMTKDQSVLARIAAIKAEYIDQSKVRRTNQTKKFCKRGQ